jgi:ABC-type transport system involved in multi-copper enzyme maturation permease subunit
LEYIIALIGAIIALFIFRQPQDDGSELLVCSKPLYHTKIIASKFIVFVLTVSMFAAGSSLISCFGFCLSNVNY